MKTILLVGGGGHCRSIIDVIESHGGYAITGIVQPEKDGLDPVLGYPVIGADDDLPKLTHANQSAIVTVGQIKTFAVRQRLFERLRECHAVMPVIVSPRAYVSSHAFLADGTAIMHGAFVNAGARIGVNGIINSLALIEHDVTIGDHCHISTGARINGGTIIEDGCFIGSGAVLRQGLRIGSGSVIGAGCVLTRDLPPNSLIKYRHGNASNADHC